MGRFLDTLMEILFTVYSILINTLSTVIAIIKLPLNFLLAGIATSWHLFKTEVEDIWWEEDDYY
jgi:hypothetical protein